MDPWPADESESEREASAKLAELLERIRAGDPEAQHAFHTRFAGALDLDLANKTRSASPVLRGYNDELVHETMVVAFGKIHDDQLDFRGIVELHAWLRRVLHNKFLDLYRKLEAEPVEQAPAVSDSSTSWLQGVWSDGTGILTRLGRQEDWRLLRQAVGNLKERSRSLIELHFFWRYSWWEVAHALDGEGMAPGTADDPKKRRRHADRIRKEVEERAKPELALRLKIERRRADADGA